MRLCSTWSMIGAIATPTRMPSGRGPRLPLAITRLPGCPRSGPRASFPRESRWKYRVRNVAYALVLASSYRPRDTARSSMALFCSAIHSDSSPALKGVHDVLILVNELHVGGLVRDLRRFRQGDNHGRPFERRHDARKAEARVGLPVELQDAGRAGEGQRDLGVTESSQGVLVVDGDGIDAVVLGRDRRVRLLHALVEHLETDGRLALARPVAAREPQPIAAQGKGSAGHKGQDSA